MALQWFPAVVATPGEAPLLTISLHKRERGCILLLSLLLFLLHTAAAAFISARQRSFERCLFACYYYPSRPQSRFIEVLVMSLTFSGAAGAL